MKANPLGYLDIPESWPKTGKLPSGREIDLREAWQTGTYAGIASITVDVPGVGLTTPWSNLEWLDAFEYSDPDGEGLLSREELEAKGSSDAKLEAWAQDSHGIRIDLSADDADTRAIRADAWRRYVVETW